MELWIRSQNKKKLYNIKNFELDNDETGIFNADTYTLLGKYKSKERALEVLDEIQNILKPTIKINYEYDDSQPIMNGEWLKSIKGESKIEELSTIVYQMPEE